MDSTTSTISYAIADDQRLYRHGIIEILNDAGFLPVIEAANGRELIDKLAAADKLPDVCLLDVSMPVMDGYKAMEYIKKQWPKLKVLVISMFSHEYTIITMLTKRAKAFIDKDFAPKELVNAIHTLHQTGCYNPEYYVQCVSDNPFPELTDKEIQYLNYLAKGMTHAQIGEVMSVAERTVDGYKRSLSEKLNINSKAALVLFGIQTGLIHISAKS